MECSVHSLIVDVALLAGDQILLVKYKDINRYDHQPGWFLPDDAIKSMEHPDKAAKRIMSEQLGYRLTDARLNHVESFIGNDGTWHLPFHYAAEVNGVPSLHPSDDVSAAQWFTLKKLPPASQVAHHGWALGTIRRILRDH